MMDREVSAKATPDGAIYLALPESESMACGDGWHRDLGDPEEKEQNV